MLTCVTPLNRHVWLAELGPNMKNTDRHQFSASSLVTHLTPPGIYLQQGNRVLSPHRRGLRIKERVEERVRRELGNGVENRASVPQ